MSKPFKSDLAQETSERIYKELLNVGAPTSRKTTVRGKVNKRPAFKLGKVKGREQDSDLLPLEFYNFHYNISPKNGASQGDDSRHDLRKHNTSPCPSVQDNVEEDSMVQMLKIRATSAYVRNPECYQRNPEFFLSCTPTERRNMSNQKPVVWNRSHQALRLDKEWNAKAQCRATKLHSELVKHRTDKMYILNGAALSLKNRYSISDDETQHLRELSLARQELRNELQEAKDIIAEDSIDIVEQIAPHSSNVDVSGPSNENQKDGVSSNANVKTDTDKKPSESHAVVTVVDLLHHGSSPPVGEALVELSKTNKQPEAERSSRKNQIHTDFLNLFHAPIGQGSYVTVPFRTDSLGLINKHSTNKIVSKRTSATERLQIQKKQRFELNSANLRENRTFKQFPVRKQCFRFQLCKKAPNVCECESRTPPVVDLKGKQIPLSNKS